MRTIYLWAMRNGAPILFALSAILFLLGFAQALISMRKTIGDGLVAGVPLGEAGMQWVLFLGGTLTALSTAVLPFLGALAIHRWDRSARAKDAADAED
jgi:hypothetical protein